MDTTGFVTSMAGKFAVVGAAVVTPDTVLDQYAVIVEQESIVAVVPESELPQTLAQHRLDGGYLAPGFIDIHVHGGSRLSFNDASVESFEQIGRMLLAAGVTTALPTLSSGPIGVLRRALDVLESVRSGEGLPDFPGMHFEGPYFAVAQRGAQPPEALRTPDDGSVDILLERADLIRMISFAPELPGSVELTRRLVNSGIIAAAGHTNGTDEDLARCQQAGLSHVIHVFSGQSTLTRRGPWRVPGMLEASLVSDGLTVEMIADGKHLPPALMRLAYRCLAGNLCVVSDATAGAGLPDGSQFGMGDHQRVVENGVGVTVDRTSFAGSTTLLPAMLPIAVAALGIGIPDAVAMFTAVPARAARLDRVGRIAPGLRADLVHLDRDLVAQQIYQRGVWRPCSQL